MCYLRTASMSGTEEFPRDALVEGRQLGRWWEGKEAGGKAEQ